MGNTCHFFENGENNKLAKIGKSVFVKIQARITQRNSEDLIFRFSGDLRF